jgi:protein-disulfide isomerase
MNFRYLLTGIILTVMLVSGIVIARKVQPVQTISRETLAGAKAKGPVQAVVQIVEYSDFQCPACGAAQPIVNQFMSEYPEKIHFIFRHFPLSGHPFSPLAHQAAECASEANHFWDYHDKLYGEQLLWTQSPNPAEFFFRYARDLGLNLDNFEACLENPKISRRILDEKAQGEMLKVRSTPTFFMNGERLVGGLELKIKGETKIRQILGLPPKEESKPLVPEPLMSKVSQ